MLNKRWSIERIVEIIVDILCVDMDAYKEFLL
jgi:hypothetical protein